MNLQNIAINEMGGVRHMKWSRMTTVFVVLKSDNLDKVALQFMELEEL